MPAPTPAPSHAGADAAYRSASLGLRNVLDLADSAAAHGDLADAAETLLGALNDLAPQFATLAAFLFASSCL